MNEYFPIIDENINPCRGCPDYDAPDGCKSNGGCAKPQTNADRIRGMSDEELANALASVETGVKTYNENVYSYWLSWLKSPVEELDNGT